MYYRRLPMDLVRHIIEFVNDIDIRRELGIYSKIDISKFSILDNIMLSNHPVFFNDTGNYLFRRYVLKNAYVPVEERPTIDHDHIERKVCIHDGKVWSNVGIYHLKPKPEDPIDYAVKPYQPKYENYYWHYVQYSHILE